jgi:hypothetical protein
LIPIRRSGSLTPSTSTRRVSPSVIDSTDTPAGTSVVVGRVLVEVAGVVVGVTRVVVVEEVVVIDDEVEEVTCSSRSCNSRFSASSSARRSASPAPHPEARRTKAATRAVAIRRVIGSSLRQP